MFLKKQIDRPPFLKLRCVHKLLALYTKKYGAKIRKLLWRCATPKTGNKNDPRVIFKIRSFH